METSLYISNCAAKPPDDLIKTEEPGKVCRLALGRLTRGRPLPMILLTNICNLYTFDVRCTCAKPSEEQISRTTALTSRAGPTFTFMELQAGGDCQRSESLDGRATAQTASLRFIRGHRRNAFRAPRGPTLSRAARARFAFPTSRLVIRRVVHARQR